MQVWRPAERLLTISDPFSDTVIITIQAVKEKLAEVTLGKYSISCPLCFVAIKSIMTETRDLRFLNNAATAQTVCTIA